MFLLCTVLSVSACKQRDANDGSAVKNTQIVAEEASTKNIDLKELVRNTKDYLSVLRQKDSGLANIVEKVIALDALQQTTRILNASISKYTEANRPSGNFWRDAYIGETKADGELLVKTFVVSGSGLIAIGAATSASIEGTAIFSPAIITEVTSLVAFIATDIAALAEFTGIGTVVTGTLYVIYKGYQWSSITSATGRLEKALAGETKFKNNVADPAVLLMPVDRAEEFLCAYDGYLKAVGLDEDLISKSSYSWGYLAKLKNKIIDSGKDFSYSSCPI